MERETAWTHFNGAAYTGKDMAVRLTFTNEDAFTWKYNLTLSGYETWILIWLLIKCWALHMYFRIRSLFIWE